MDQLQLPLSFEDIIPENHLVRVVNSIVDSLDLAPLYDRYKDGGQYHSALPVSAYGRFFGRPIEKHRWMPIIILRKRVVVPLNGSSVNRYFP